MQHMSAEEYKKMQSKRETSEKKYKNIKAKVDGILFDSQKEANRYCELKLLLRAGQIQNLLRQVKFKLISKSSTERAVNYIADFVYMQDGQTIVEDVKGIKTQTYIIKRKLMKERYPEVVFRET